MLCDADGKCAGLSYWLNQGRPQQPTRPQRTYSTVGWNYFGSPPPGARRITVLGPVVKGGGIIVARFFIPTYEALPKWLDGGLLGDNRGFSLDPSAGYRVALAWDTSTGVITYTVSPSYAPPPKKNIYGPPQAGNKPGRIIYSYPKRMLPAHGIGSSDGLGNGTTVTAVPGGIEADYVGLNSLLPCCQVSGQVTIAFTRAGISVHLSGIQYPAFEAI